MVRRDHREEGTVCSVAGILLHLAVVLEEGTVVLEEPGAAEEAGTGFAAAALVAAVAVAAAEATAMSGTAMLPAVAVLERTCHRYCMLALQHQSCGSTGTVAVGWAGSACCLY